MIGANNMVPVFVFGGDRHGGWRLQKDLSRLEQPFLFSWYSRRLCVFGCCCFCHRLFALKLVLSLSLSLLLLLLLLWLSIPSKNTRRKEGTHEGTNKRQHANGSTQVSQHHSPRLRSIQLHKQSHTFEFISVHLTALHWIALQTHTHTHK